MSKFFYSYIFEVKSVQNYLFSSGKLKDMVVASDELDQMTKSLLDHVLDELGLVDVLDTRVRKKSLTQEDVKHSDRVYFSRRAGGAVYGVFTNLECRNKFQAVWSFLIRNRFPGVELLQVAPLHSADTEYGALEIALDELDSARNIQVPSLPISTPITQLTPRTGRAAVKNEKGEAIDEITQSQRAVARATSSEQSSLTAKFLDDAQLIWPKNFDRDDLKSGPIFPFSRSDSKEVALLHADGNGLGQVIMRLRSVASQLSKSNGLEAIKVFRNFSNIMEEATNNAVRTASEAVFKKQVTAENIVPARPLVLGGDDITLICRPDLALPFFKAFAVAFEQETGAKLGELTKKNYKAMGNSSKEYDLPLKLTASAGIAIIKAGQPFMECHELVEDLCSLAKKKGKELVQASEGIAPAAVSFHRIAATRIQSVSGIRTDEWQVGENEYISLEAYGLDENTRLPSLVQLEQMLTLFYAGDESLNLNSLREIAGNIKNNRRQAARLYQRWKEMAQQQELLEPLKTFERLLEELTASKSSEEIPLSESENKSPRRSPLADLIALSHFS